MIIESSIAQTEIGMACTKNENLFTLWEQVKTILNAKDEWNCDLTYANILSNAFCPSATINDLMEIKLFSVYTAKNDDLDGISAELSKVERSISLKISRAMEALGFKTTHHKIDLNALKAQYEDFEHGCEHDFSNLMFTFTLSKQALKSALSACNEKNKSLKKAPLYISHATFKNEDDVMVLDLANLKLENQSQYALRLGNEHLSNDYHKLAMGLAPNFSTPIFTETFEVLQAKKTIYTNIEGEILLSDGKQLKLKIDCSTHSGGIHIQDNDGNRGYGVLSYTSLNSDFFELPPAQMKKFLTKHLVRGAKITDLTVSKFNHKLALSNNAKYKEIHLFIDNPLIKFDHAINPMRIVINKKGEVQAYTNNGTKHPEALAISQLCAEKLDPELLKDIFCQNRRFAYLMLGKQFSLTNRKNRILFS